MVSNLPGRWAVAAPTFVLWALVAGSAVFWALKFGASPNAPAAPATPRTPPAVDAAAVARLLGSNPTVAAASPVPNAGSRFALVGVVAGRSHKGAALIVIDGKPAKPFNVGAAVDEGLVLQAVEPRRALLGPSMDGAATVTLELPLAKK
jgi:general secretion pathway protein C